MSEVKFGPYLDGRSLIVIRNTPSFSGNMLNADPITYKLIWKSTEQNPMDDSVAGAAWSNGRCPPANVPRSNSLSCPKNNTCGMAGNMSCVK